MPGALRACWAVEPDERPPFIAILETVRAIARAADGRARKEDEEVPQMGGAV